MYSEVGIWGLMETDEEARERVQDEEAARINNQPGFLSRTINLFGGLFRANRGGAEMAQHSENT